MSTVMFIHGAWLTPAAWDLFRGRFEENGFETLAPPWPYEDVPIEQLRRAPHRAVSTLTIKQIVDHYDARVRALPERPILVGHSYGGLFVQMLLDRGLGAAGVAIDPVPIRGVLPTSRALRSALPALGRWNGWKQTVTMSFEQFARDFAQTLPKDQLWEAYERYIVPAPGLLYWQAAFSVGNKIHSTNPNRPPLLLIAGEEDLTIEASMVRATYAKQRKAPSETAFKAFPGRSHFLIHEPGWEEVADYAIEWIRQLAPIAVPVPVPEPVAPPPEPVRAPPQGVPAA